MSWLAQRGASLCCFPGVIIIKAPLYSQQCPSWDDKLHGQLTKHTRARVYHTVLIRHSNIFYSIFLK